MRPIKSLARHTRPAGLGALALASPLAVPCTLASMSSRARGRRLRLRFVVIAPSSRAAPTAGARSCPGSPRRRR